MQRQKIEEKTVQVKCLKSGDKPPVLLCTNRSAHEIGKGNKKVFAKPAEGIPRENTDGVPNQAIAPSTRPQSGQSVLSFSEFLKSLLTSDSGGRVIRDGKALKFLLLSTSDHFSDIMSSARLPCIKNLALMQAIIRSTNYSNDEIWSVSVIVCRSIILAGGTMKPYDEVEDQLFHTARNRLFHFSCDHVIPDENLVCMSLNRGPTGKLFDFTYQNRKTPETVRTKLFTLKITHSNEFQYPRPVCLSFYVLFVTLLVGRIVQGNYKCVENCTRWFGDFSSFV